MSIQTSDKIRMIRQLTGVSLRELARRLELTPAAVSFIETGENNATITRIEQIEAVLGFRRGFITHPETEAALLHFQRWRNGN